MSKHPEDQTERMLEMFENLRSDKYPLKEYKYIGTKDTAQDRRPGQGFGAGRLHHGHPASRHVDHAIS